MDACRTRSGTGQVLRILKPMTRAFKQSARHDVPNAFAQWSIAHEDSQCSRNICDMNAQTNGPTLKTCPIKYENLGEKIFTQLPHEPPSTPHSELFITDQEIIKTEPHLAHLGRKICGKGSNESIIPLRPGHDIGDTPHTRRRAIFNFESQG